MYANEESRFKRALLAVRKWFNLGFTDNQLGSFKYVTPYSIVLAADNLTMLPRACAFSCALSLAIGALLVFMAGATPAVVAPAIAAVAVFSVIAAFASREIKDVRKPRSAMRLALAFCITWYAFVMYCDLVLQPTDGSILTCLAFLALPLLFDARPADNLIGSIVALAAFVALEFFFGTPGAPIMDVLGAVIGIAVGTVIGQRKTATKLNEIIYLDMYKTATKTSVLVAQIDLRTDTFHTLQIPDYISPVVSCYTSATELLKRVGESFVTRKFLDDYLGFFDFESLKAHLAGSDQANFTFQDYRRRWCQATVVAQSKRDGVLETAVIIVRDIDEEKRQELDYQQKLHDIAIEARRANVSKTNFLRRMSHNIRTPINGIRGVVDIANHFPDDMAKQAECREKIQTASGFLLSLVNNVLDMSKLESGAIELEHKPFDLVLMSREVNAIMSSQATEHGVTIVPGARARNITHRYLVGSPVHFQQILLNLGSNAVKYNRPGGTVAMGCREISCDGETAVYEIVCKDTGLGMSEEFQKRAFEPFVQEEHVTSTAYTGSGLGLAIVKELVERMGGTIALESAEGVGTTFTLTIPFELDKNHVEQAPQALQPASLEGKRALLVEDDDLNAEIAEFVLGNEGLEVQRVANGKEAVNAFESAEAGTFDMIFMDVMMPVMNGLDATRAIRASKHPDASSIPIFAMTANAFYDDERESLNAGTTAHLTKPLEIDKIRLAISRALATRA